MLQCQTCQHGRCNKKKRQCVFCSLNSAYLDVAVWTLPAWMLQWNQCERGCCISVVGLYSFLLHAFSTSFLIEKWRLWEIIISSLDSTLCTNTVSNRYWKFEKTASSVQSQCPQATLLLWHFFICFLRLPWLLTCDMTKDVLPCNRCSCHWALLSTCDKNRSVVTGTVLTSYWDLKVNKTE